MQGIKQLLLGDSGIRILVGPREDGKGLGPGEKLWNSTVICLLRCIWNLLYQIMTVSRMLRLRELQ